MAIMAFQGKLIAGVGKALRLYDMGKKKLLRKVENKVRSIIFRLERALTSCIIQNFSSAIVTLNTQGSRIIVGDMQESVFYTVYKAPENRLLTFADNMQPRWVTATTMLDYNTVVAGDRFGNIFVNQSFGPEGVRPGR